MAINTWLRLFEAVGGLAAASKRLRGDQARPEQGLATGGALGQLETRLAGVVVAALKEAFDRDRARLDLEQAHIEAERRRAEEALRLELLRQAGDRVLFQARLLAVMSLAVWMISTILMIALPAMREPLSRLLLGSGWAALIAALACAFASHQATTSWLAAARTGTRDAEIQQGAAGAAVPWLLILGLTLTAASLIAAL